MADLASIKDQLSALTIMEAAQLVKDLEESWGVKAATGGGGGCFAKDTPGTARDNPAAMQQARKQLRNGVDAFMLVSSRSSR